MEVVITHIYNLQIIAYIVTNIVYIYK